jgi:hypothetical protein
MHNNNNNVAVMNSMFYEVGFEVLTAVRPDDGGSKYL